MVITDKSTTVATNVFTVFLRHPTTVRRAEIIGALACAR